MADRLPYRCKSAPSSCRPSNKPAIRRSPASGAPPILHCDLPDTPAILPEELALLTSFLGADILAILHEPDA